MQKACRPPIAPSISIIFGFAFASAKWLNFLLHIHIVTESSLMYAYPASGQTIPIPANQNPVMLRSQSQSNIFLDSQLTVKDIIPTCEANSNFLQALIKCPKPQLKHKVFGRQCCSEIYVHEVQVHLPVN